MKTFAAVAALAGAVSAASSGWGAPVYVTDVVTAYTTYCPSATMITHGGTTYTVTSATTLTITNCPCTITRPVSSSVYASSYCPTAASSVMPPPAPPASSGMPAPVAPKSSGYFPVVPTPTSSSAPAGPTYTGAANKAQVAGAGIVALMGLAAAL